MKYLQWVICNWDIYQALEKGTNCQVKNRQFVEGRPRCDFTDLYGLVLQGVTSLDFGRLIWEHDVPKEFRTEKSSGQMEGLPHVPFGATVAV